MKINSPRAVVLQKNVVDLFDHRLILHRVGLVGLVLTAKHPCELLLGAGTLPVALKHAILRLLPIVKVMAVCLLDSWLEDRHFKIPGILVFDLDLDALNSSAH